MGKDEVGMLAAAQRSLEQEAVAVVEDLHLADGTGPRGAASLERAPRVEVPRHGRQEAVPSVDVARTGALLDFQDTEVAAVGERQRESGAAHACTRDEHVSIHASRSIRDITVTAVLKLAQRKGSSGTSGGSLRNQARSGSASPASSALTQAPEATDSATPRPHQPTACTTAWFSRQRWMA